MTEMEFFIEYEIRPDPGIPGRGVEIWKRNSGYFGAIRIVNHDDYVAEVPAEQGIGRRSLGVRRSFDGAFKLLRAHLSA
ncbi:hypothetical protein [Amycolatopsis nalaikhensis]|uniref:Uncharacterized protein n=1 Tax=Amycolatopsis nalaikhensis TaxID=715472 RepID=A0ABY8XQE3_9PSEU|nr:hypothetical protein [Amycolatopsis sp. 2-2]WIV57890.1 hypothetical protein QP939_04190 [Amycolatopsis sp. 2-2]